jgi:hypothetical protein
MWTAAILDVLHRVDAQPVQVELGESKTVSSENCSLASVLVHHVGQVAGKQALEPFFGPP